MRRILFLGFVILINNSFAQKNTNTKDSILKLVGDEVCSEIKKVAASGKKINNMETELGIAMLPAVKKYKDELTAIYGNKLFEDTTMEKIGEDLGVSMALNCPEFLTFIANNSKEVEEKTLEGSFVKFVASELSYIEIKLKNGKVEKLYWFEYFEGSDMVTSSASTIGTKKIEVTYSEKEIYKASIKEYVKIKIITKLTIIE